MEIQKQFSFFGTFKKQHEEDNNPIEIVAGNIFCNKDGSIFIEIDAETNRRIRHKRFFEHVPVYKLKNTPDITEDLLSNPSFITKLCNLEQELVQTPYEGDYLIQGKSNEGWVISAKIADANFTTSFSSKDSVKSREENHKYLIKLQEFCIDYHPESYPDKLVEIKYGLSNLELFCDLPKLFLESKYEMSLISTTSENMNSPEMLSTEMTLKCIDGENLTVTYPEWIKLLISFATGKSIREIYRIETSLNGATEKKVEFWSGDRARREGCGIAVFQKPHLHLFIQKCVSRITYDIFDKKGLGLALCWYINAFKTDMISVQFMLFCTILETLNIHHKTEESNRLISRNLYKKIRSEILAIISQNQDSINNEDLSKYQIFKKKVEKSLTDGSLNKVGSLRASLKRMLEFYKVPYSDLFPELEFIKIRDKIVHEGFGGLDVSSELYKLSNLVMRIFLAMLQYEGDYIEYRKIEINDKVGKYGLDYKVFSVIKENQ
jgi:hypothetical protein